MQYEYIYCVVHKTYIPYLGTIFFSRYPSVALARNFINERATVVVTHPVVRFLFRLNDELVGKWPTEYNTYTI